MMAAPLISLQAIQLAFGHHALLDRADLTIDTNERVGLIGRNGAGKSSLLKLLDGRLAPDDGNITRVDGIRVATVEQEPVLAGSTILEVLSAPEHQPTAESWEREVTARQWADRLELDPQASVATLSGGMAKRVALAAAMLGKPDLLLLDEPTNHLDLNGISWLEQQLKQWRGSVLFITHDRRFLDEIATRIIELDRGKLLSFPGNFVKWQQQKEAWLNAQQLANARFDKLLAQEEVWIRKGIEARRTRNEGRVRRLEQLRRERAQRRDALGKVNLKVDQTNRSGKIVAELHDVSLAYENKLIIDHFSTVILRGDRIGLIGPNGAGKTTLLKVILGELKPSSGEVKLGTNLQVAYLDQMRDQLDETAAVLDVINPGSQWVEIGQERKHVMSYLGDFLFEPARAQSPVSSLSGGERARLLLARLFARPANVIVLDEPTNDLDIETLELLEALLQEFSGTVLLVSHDRQFLDNVVTQTIAYEGHGKWGCYVGGFDDWVAQRPAPAVESTKPKPPKTPHPQKPSGSAKRVRLSTWEQRELDELPARIQTLEEQQAALTATLGAPELYQAGGDEATKVQADLAKVEAELLALYERWEVLESRQTPA
ncbi:ATP-binding cassette domain-containing protein [Orrella daihaiensis]|uniref:ATP-binding protein Uup n=1 Tax=Orrella daihaiensis TaxID=2782176 RepID=A0ABY4AU03_9BURK|nr:ATP-binding cassette domain-containing protein [Orrella daihaiensis]UOD51529.1 ATP-binding cassette domain-containing protein [Orrella daihaiensis]